MKNRHFEDEVEIAKRVLDANEEGRFIEDTHEDLRDDTNDGVTTVYTSYKEDHEKLLKFHKELNKRSEEQRKKALESLKGDKRTKKYKDECDAINKKFDSIIKLENEHYKEIDAKLKTKYEDEIKYKIPAKLKRRPLLINSDVLLSVRNLKQFFFFGSKVNHQKLKAVSNVSFDVYKGECFGLVGESGCGKTTTGRTIIKLYKPTSGSIYYKGYRIGAGSRWNEKEIQWTTSRSKKKIKELRKDYDANIAKLEKNDPKYNEKKNLLTEKLNAEIRMIEAHVDNTIRVQKQKIKEIKYDDSHTPKKLISEIQMIFQDPVDSLDPRMTVEDIIQEGLTIQGYHNKKENHQKVVEMLTKVGLVEEHCSRYPHEFSGGQRQRIGIARALVMNPKLLICDEPISALDVSIRAQVINLLNDLKEEMGLTLIFIAHDLSVVKYFCDRIAVMYFGKIVELATSDELFKHPLHPYTISLLSAIPKPNPLTEKERTRIIYKPFEAHDYEKDKPVFQEVIKGHFVYCNNKELLEYRAKIKELDLLAEKKVNKEK